MWNDVIRFFASDAILFCGILAAAVFFLLKSRETKLKFLVVLIVAGILALIFAKVAGIWIHDSRPFVEWQTAHHCQIYSDAHLRPLIEHRCDNGFPSDHTLLASVIGFAILPFAPLAGVIGLILALMIGAARVFANVHHWYDIAGSFLFTAVAVTIAYYAVKVWFAKTKLGQKILHKFSKMKFDKLH